MFEIKSPTLQISDPDRYIDCRLALEAAFHEITRLALRAGWDPHEIYSSLLELSTLHVEALVESKGATRH